MAYSCQTTQNFINSAPNCYDRYWSTIKTEDFGFSAITPDIHSFTSDCVFDNSNLNLHSDSDSYYTGSRPSSTQLSENEFTNYSNMDLCDDTTYLLSLPDSNDWTLASSRNRHAASPPASSNYYTEKSRLSPMMSEISFYEDIHLPPDAFSASEAGRRTPPPPYRPPVNNTDISCESVTLETMFLKMKPPPSYTETVNNSTTKYGTISTGFTVNSGTSQNSPLTADRSRSAVSTSSDLVILPMPSAFQVGGFREQRAVGEETSTEVLVPADPELWEKDHIDHWLTKVENYYGLCHIERTHMPGDGESLCRLSADDFHRITGDRRTAEILSSYLDCIRQNIKFSPQSSMENSGGNENKKTFFEAIKQIVGKNPQKKSASPTGGGQIQLWQFLLELLLDSKYSSYIGWQDDNGTFRFFDPDGTAKLWGERKLNESKTKKPMTYEKLSRSLRHYYDKGIVIKANNQKYTYKFIIDGVLRACSPSGVSDSTFIYPNFDPNTCDNSSPRNFNLNLQ